MPTSGIGRLARALVTLGFVILGMGCDRGPAAPAPAARQGRILGQVTDALLRGTPGATVEILNGDGAGAKMVTGADGNFEFTSTAPVRGFVTLFASTDAQTTTAQAQWGPPETFIRALLRMPALEPVEAPEPGEYDLTISIDVATARSRLADAPCPGFPSELASRNYTARVAAQTPDTRWVAINGPAGPLSAFTMFLTGDRAVFDVGDDGLREDLPGFQLLTVWAGALPDNPGQLTRGSSVSILATGEFRYCELKAFRGRYNECSQVPRDQMLKYHSCTSDRTKVTFTRR